MMKKLFLTVASLFLLSGAINAQINYVRIDVTGKFEVTLEVASGLYVTIDRFGNLQDVEGAGNEKITYFIGQIDRIGDTQFEYHTGDQLKKIGDTEFKYEQGDRIYRIGKTDIRYTVEGYPVLIGETEIAYDYSNKIVRIGNKPFTYGIDGNLRSGERIFSLNNVNWFVSGGL